MKLKLEVMPPRRSPHVKWRRLHWMTLVLNGVALGVNVSAGNIASCFVSGGAMGFLLTAWYLLQRKRS